MDGDAVYDTAGGDDARGDGRRATAISPAGAKATGRVKRPVVIAACGS
jgi:hypothetical protein